MPSTPFFTPLLLVFLGSACLAHAERGPRNTVFTAAQAEAGRAERNGAVAGTQPLDAATAVGIASLAQGRP